MNLLNSLFKLAIQYAIEVNRIGEKMKFGVFKVLKYTKKLYIKDKKNIYK